MAKQAANVKGSLFVVDDQSSLNADATKGTVVIESTDENFPNAIETLRSVDARNLALQWAAKEGMGDPRINGMLIGPYAINSKGDPLDKVMEANAANPLPPNHALMQPSAYRVEVPVARSIR